MSTATTLEPVSAAAANFAVHVPVSLPTRSLSTLRLIYNTLVTENPALWSYRQGARNPQADFEGPYYVIGAPDRNISEGKGVLASYEEISSTVPFLLSLRILDMEGKPVPNVSLDWWQANGEGVYYQASYNMRGKFKTDADGRMEVLTVPPGKYGPKNHMRAGHFHLVCTPPEEHAQRVDALTTQVYVCKGNDPNEMGPDFLNMFRSPRPGNVLDTWCIPTSNDGKPYMEVPALSADNSEMKKKVDWWDAKLARHGGLKIVLGGHVDIKLSAKSGWF